MTSELLPQNDIPIILSSLSIVYTILQIRIKMIRGSFPAYLIPLIGAASGTLSIIIVYFLSQYYHHEPPFPRTWISATADHYPEFVVFRIGTISGSVFLVLSYLVNHFWVRQVGFENAFRVRKYQPRIGMILGIMGGLALMGSTANLNTGKP